MQEIKDNETTIKDDKQINFKGKYILAIGRRKRSAALVRLYKNGKGHILVNETRPGKYFSQDKVIIVNQPLKLTGHLRDMDFSIVVKGGGKNGQAEAIRHGLARALVNFDKELRPSLKAKGWLTRDSRKVERKKPGLKKARRAPQWSKR